MRRAWPLALGALFAARLALASDEDAAAAQRLFDEGRTLMNAGRLDEACVKLAASEKLSHAGGTVLNLAECHARAGRTASAWSRFREAASLAHAAGRADAEELATKRADELFAALPYLAVDVGADDAVVHRDGTPLPREAWGTLVPVDPGAHVVEVTRPGFRAWRWEGRVGERARVTVRPVWTPEERAHERPSSVAPIVGWSLVGAGGVGLVLTGVLAGVASSEYAGASRVCPDPTRCGDRDAVQRAHGAKGLADGATGALVVGAALATAGLAVVLFWPRGDRSGSGAALRLDARGVTFEVTR